MQSTLFTQIPLWKQAVIILFVAAFAWWITMFVKIYYVGQSIETQTYSPSRDVDEFDDDARIVDHVVIPSQQISVKDVQESDNEFVARLESYIDEYTNGESPMLGHVDDLHAITQDQNKTKIALAIAGVESRFGADQSGVAKCNNFFGYLYHMPNNPRGCGSPRWNTPQNGITRFATLESNNWLTLYDGTDESLILYTQQIDGMGTYCASACTHYIDSLKFFLEEFES